MSILGILGLSIMLCAVLDILYTGIGLLDICIIISGVLLLLTTTKLKQAIFKSPPGINELVINILILVISFGIILVPLKYTEGKGSLAAENKLLKESSNLINNGMYAEAEQLFSVEDNRPENMINLSTALLMQEKPEEAFEVLQRIGNSSYKPEMQNYNYAMAYYQLNEYTLASEYLRKAMVYRPDRMEAYLYAGESSLIAKKYKAAQYYFKIAAAIEPQNPYAHYHLGRAYLEVMDFNHAKTEFTKAFELTGDQSLQKKISKGLNETGYYLEQIHK